MNSDVKKFDECGELCRDLARLAKLAAAEAQEDVRLLLASLVRKYRGRLPELASQLDGSLKATQTRGAASDVLRRQGSALVEPVPDTRVPMDADTRLSLVKVFDDRQGMAAPLLKPVLNQQIEAIVRERVARDKLLQHGIAPTRSVILVGPPGVGKTLSARWIAAKLGKPLWVLDLSALMSSLLGRTGTNLRQVLDFAKEHQGVLLLDEIDAIAKRRADESDVGELKRLVTVLLQEIDQWPDTGLLLAATNHAELIDPALWRRFDAVLRFDSPNVEATRAAIERYMGGELLQLKPWVEALNIGLRGRSISDVQRAVSAIRRAQVLEPASVDEVVSALLNDGMETKTHADRLALAIDMARGGLLSHQAISRTTGISRDTIRKHAGPSARQGRGKK